MATAPASQRLTTHDLLDVFIRASLITVLVAFSYWVFYPFLNLLLWSMILAVTMYPLQRWLRAKFGGRDGLAATVIVLVAIAILLVPIYLLGASIAGSAQQAIAMIRGGGLHVPPPNPAVAGWPVIGDSAYALWTQASTDLASVTQQYQPQLRAVATGLLGKLAGFASGLLLFIVAVILAGIFMAYGESGQRSAVHAASRISGPVKGPQIATLCTATIRAVAQGVIGIAFIQMFLVGIAFVLFPVPAAGFLCIVVLFLGIIQVPATLVTIPVIIYVIATHGVTTGTIIFTIYVFIAGLADNVLKPLMLGRGVSVPMPVILIGAIGGMVTGGIVGLFIGPVILGVTYELFWQWVREVPAPGVQPDVEPAEPAPALVDPVGRAPA